MSFVEQDILSQLDRCAREGNFPAADADAVHLADMRLRAYRAPERWAIVIERIGYHKRAWGHDAIDMAMYIYGNDLIFAPGLSKLNYFFPTEDAPTAPTFDQEFAQQLNPECNSFLLRGQEIPITQDPQYYAAHGIELEDAPLVGGWEFLRGLLPQYRDLFFATQREIMFRLKAGFKEILRLESWHHPDVLHGELPGNSRTFREIAAALTANDGSRYTGSGPSNSSWENR